MHFPRLLHSLPFLPVSYGSAAPQPAAIDHHYGPPGGNYYARRASISTATLSNSNLTTSTVAILTFVTPSPSAAAIPITSQSQIVTSYIPISTTCPSIPSAAPYSASAFSSASAPVSYYSIPSNYSLPYNTSAPLLKRQASAYQNITFPAPTGSYLNTTTPTALYPNLTATTPLNMSPSTPICSTIYSPTVTPICHTTLTPLGAPPIPITACLQNVTFSTDHWHTTSASQTTSLTTKLFANWDAIATGVPTGPVWAEICGDGSACETVMETWDGGEYFTDSMTDGGPTTTYSRTSTRMMTVTVVPTAA